MPFAVQIIRQLQHFTQTVMEMVYPPKCRLCGRFTVNESPSIQNLDFGQNTPPANVLFSLTTPNLCRHCLAGYLVLPPDNCSRCGCVPENSVCINCQIHPPQYVDRCISLLIYNNEIGPVIKGFKYNNNLYLGRFLSLCLLAGLAIFAQSGIKYNVVVPVPLHSQKLKARKFNQNERLMHYWPKFNYRQVAGLQNSVLDCRLLSRRKNTRTQAGLDSPARAENVADAFAVTNERDLSGLNMLVIDDIVTTGATVENCAKALKAAGALRVDVISIARTMPHLNPNHLLEI